MTGPDRYRTALAALNLPTEWRIEVAIRPRRRSVAVEVKPGGDVAVLVPPTVDPEQVVQFVGSHRRWISERVGTATRLAPDHPVKQFVDGEPFDLLGRHHQLQLVDTAPPPGEHLPAATTDGVLYVRRQRPAQIRRAVIDLYRRVGLAWLRQHGAQYEVDGRITGLTYVVRDLGRRRWGLYTGPPTHSTTVHWSVFGLPMRSVEYVLVHEQAHAALHGVGGHDRAWRRQMTLWMPDWRERQAELAEVGRHAWLGDWNPRS